MRQIYAARLLQKQGRRVYAYGCCTEDAAPPVTLSEAVRNADVILAPIPLSTDRDYLNQKGGNQPVLLETLLECMSEGQEFYGGCIPGRFAAAAAEKGVYVVDLMEQEEIALYNTVATAEGAVAEAITKSPRNLRGSRCLVIGYGRCARTLAALLRGMGCHTGVCARDCAQRAQAAVFADEAFDFSKLDDVLPRYDFVFNTVPAVILGRGQLCRLKTSACVFDLASAPGGTDFEAAAELGISAWLLPGLPGRYAPESSAKEMVDFILRSGTGA